MDMKKKKKLSDTGKYETTFHLCSQGDRPPVSTVGFHKLAGQAGLAARRRQQQGGGKDNEEGMGQGVFHGCKDTDFP